MAGVNKVFLIGNLGADPETRYTQGGSPVTNFRIATSETWKDKQTGEKQERTEWHSIVTFGRLAEIAGEYLRKGSKVYLEGKLQTSSWDDKDTGQKRYKTEVIARELQMLDGKPDGHQARPQQSAPVEPRQEPGTGNDFDDDIPF